LDQADARWWRHGGETVERFERRQDLRANAAWPDFGLS